MIEKVTVKNNVKVTGNKHASTTMIFAHGFGTDQTAWDEVSAAFEADYRIIRYDNVGGGNADPAAYSFYKYTSLHPYADDLLMICEAFDVKDAIIVAHSVSSMIAILAGLRQPACFSQLVLLGASPRYLDDDGYHGGFTQNSLDELYRSMSTNYHAWVSGFAQAVMANPERPSLSEDFATGLYRLRPDVAQAVVKVIFQSDNRQYMPEVQHRTLIMQTKEDVAVPMDVAHYLHKNIANSELAIVDATGHFPHISAPAEVISLIKGFIKA